MGWRNVSFRGFADYMQTPEFVENLADLIEQATRERVVLMCAEAVPWRCHCSLITDALVVHRIRAEEIINATRLQLHTLTTFAKMDGTVIAYPPQAPPPESQNLFAWRINQSFDETARRALDRWCSYGGLTYFHGPQSTVKLGVGVCASSRRVRNCCAEAKTLDCMVESQESLTQGMEVFLFSPLSSTRSVRFHA